MNIDINIVARALDKAGEEPLTPEEVETKKGTRWRLIKDIYLATILEELASVAWTSQKRRAKLTLSDKENMTSYLYMYDLPLDCAKPVALNTEKEFLVEEGYLYTNDAEPILVYITNYFTGKYEFIEADPQPTEDTFEDKAYYKETINPETEEVQHERAWLFEEDVTYFVIDEQDYNFYSDPKMDPLLEETIETRLASKIVLKLTGDTGKYQFLYQEAMIMENKAQKASFAQGHNKGKGSPLWGEVLGLPNYGEDN